MEFFYCFFFRYSLELIGSKIGLAEIKKKSKVFLKVYEDR